MRIQKEINVHFASVFKQMFKLQPASALYLNPQIYMVNNVQSKTKPNPIERVGQKVWIVKDGDGVEVFEAWTKKELYDWFDDTVVDYFDFDGTVHEDERFYLVLPDGQTLDLYDFKNKTQARKAFQKAVAIFYYGSSCLAAWINPKRVTPEAKKAIGEFELIQREFAAYGIDTWNKVFKNEDGMGLMEITIDGSLLAEVDLTPDELEAWRKELKESGYYYETDDDDLIGFIEGQMKIYIREDGTGMAELTCRGALMDEIDLTKEEVGYYLPKAEFIEEITEFPDFITEEEAKQLLETLAARDGNVEEMKAATDEAPAFDFGTGAEDGEIIGGNGMKKEEKVEKLETGEIPEFVVENVEDKEERKARGIPIHFVGLRYYTVQSFIEEAEKLGVSRALPPKILKQFKWGSKIYLAIHSKRETEDDQKVPIATVFGFFTIDGINLKASQRLHDAVLNDPRVQVVEHQIFDQPMQESRGCGEYAVASATAVRVELATLIQVIEEHARRFGEKFKIMATGRFYEILPVKLMGVKFTQNITWAIPPEKAMEDLNAVLPRKSKRKTRKVKHVKNYKLRKQFNDIKEAQEELKQKGWF